MLWNKYDVRSKLLFPAQDTGEFFQNVSVGRKFNKIWERTVYAVSCVQKPTVHSLRYSFVVKRMNLWMENNEDQKTLMPYLSKLDRTGYTGNWCADSK